MDRIDTIKLSLIIEQPFFGYLLMHIQLKKDESIESIGTDGENIYYNESFIENANDDEIKFLIMHQILHIVLNHIIRSANYTDEKTFGKASDLVVNSIVYESLQQQQYIIDNLKNINMEHIIDGNEASKYTVDQAYEVLKKVKIEKDDEYNDNDNDMFFTCDDVTMGFEPNNGENGEDNQKCDDHSMWENMRKKSFFERGEIANKWSLYLKDAANFVTNKYGSMPGYLNRFIAYMERSKVDWKDALRNFIETEITDYSFNPPDKRYTTADILLPDFNEPEEKVVGVFFFIDVSGSMDDEQIAECKAELRSCIKQYNGKIDGYLGYFDYQVSNLKSFDDEESMENIDFLGGGGTSFENIFTYLDENADKFNVNNKKVVIMTDGYAPFPDESSLNVDEVLWIINNDDVTPPYGDIVRI